MKKCIKCGTLQSDNVKLCVDCNEPLGKSLSYYEAKQAMAGDLSDYLYVSKADKIIIVLHSIGLLVTIVSLVILNDEYIAGFSAIAVLLFIIGIQFSAFPKTIWNRNVRRSHFIINNIDNLRPSSDFITQLKASSFVALIIGYILLIPSIIKFFHIQR